MTKKSPRKSSPPSRYEHSSSPDDGLVPNFLKLLVGGLLVSRWLVPAEAAVFGETLWMVQLWLAAGVLWGWSCWRAGDFRVRFGWLDGALWLLVAGHVVSALVVVATGGHQRAAINMLWEWVALGVSFFLVRQLLRTRAEARRLLLAMTAAAVALAGLGVWQHYVWYPQQAAQYRQAWAELEQLQQAGPPRTRHEAAERQRRLHELHARIDYPNVPLEGPARRMLEDRIEASTEPLGLFALTNTFAGLLAAWLFVAAAVVMGAWRQMRERHVRHENLPPFIRGGRGGEAEAGVRSTPPGPPLLVRGGVMAAIRGGVMAACSRLMIGPAAAAGLIAYCLVLTKSRTAVVGLLAGMAVWGWLWLRRDAVSPRKWLVGALTAGMVLAGLLGVAALSGGFDREVVAEAPKSLRYRLQYWAGSWEVVRERPVLGTGPGNFRQHYLRHKLPESSEEVLDPHNFVFDVWTSAGLMGLTGLAALIVLGAAAVSRREPNDPARTLETRGSDKTGTGTLATQTNAASSAGSREPVPVSSEPLQSLPPVTHDPLILGAGLSFVVVFAVGWFLGTTDLRLWGGLAGWAFVVAVLARAFDAVRIPAACLGAGCAALMVHLLGAGGIEMPAVVQTLLVLLAVATVPARERKGTGTVAGRSSTDQARGTTEPVPFLSQPLPKGDAAGLAVRGRHFTPVAAGGAMGVLFVACLLTATAPVWHRQVLVQLGDASLWQDGDPVRAQRFYREAAERDPFSPEPAERLAELAFQQWLARPTASDADFHRAEELRQAAIALDPYNPNGYRTLGRWRLEKFRRSRDPHDAQAAAAAFFTAAERYPHNASLRAELADALAQAEQADEARRQAEQALRLDDINRREGHRDKHLPEETLVRLREIAGQ